MNNFTKAAASLTASALFSLAFTACSDSTSANDEIFANISSSSDEIVNPEVSSSSEKATSKESSSSEKSNSKESSSSEGIKAPSDSFTDARDGKTYKLANIGGQVWMAEDLSYGDSSLTPSKTHWMYARKGSTFPRSRNLKHLSILQAVPKSPLKS